MNRIRAGAAAARVALAVAAALGTSAAWALNSPVVLDFLGGTDGFQIGQTTAIPNFGDAVAVLPDLNGDGLGEIAVAAPASNGGSTVYVLYGRPGASIPVYPVEQIDGSNGFRVTGVGTDRLGTEVRDAGDFNGDGRRDLLLMTRGVNRAYVVLGRAVWPATVDLLRAPIGVVELSKPAGRIGRNGSFGDVTENATSSGNGHDYNGDGYSDLAVITADAPAAAVSACAVVYGRPVISGQINLDNLNGTAGFTFRSANAQAGIDGCALVGDTNGDGFADLAATSYRDPDPNGSAFVLLGRAGNPALVLTSAAAPPGGFRIAGPPSGFPDSEFGSELIGPGDLNNDGLADLVLGSYVLSRIHVVFGRRTPPSPVFAALLDGNDGFVVTDGVQRIGSSIAPAGDVDDDGIADLLIGVRLPGGPNQSPGPRSWVQFGRLANFPASSATASFNNDMGVLNSVLQDPDPGVGATVGGGHDVNGDGIDDYVVGRAGGNGGGGSAYVVFGKAGRLVCSTASAAIPDNNASGITRSITLASNSPVALMEPFVNIAHTWVGDLTAWLSSPAGTTIPLVDRPGHNPSPPFPAPIGLCAADNMVLTLADNAATSVDLDCSRSDVAGTPAYAGTRYRPTQSLTPFSGQGLAGNWQLRVADNGVQDLGTLTRWCLSFYPARVAPPQGDLILRTGFE